MRQCHRVHAALAAPLMVLSLAGCSLLGESGGPEADQAAQQRVVLVTHDSFVLPEELIEAFEEDSGLDLVVRSAGDAGTLTNKLVLTQDSPTGDVAFGVDNTFASRALSAGVFADSGMTLPPGAADFALADGTDRLVPIDTGNVCVNIDIDWFAERGLRQPRTLTDLTDPAYADLLAVPGAATSSPGLAFLLATIAEFGDGWGDYWRDLMANGAALSSGWSDAYYVDFTQGGGDGDRPMVVSYDSSPAFTPSDDGTRSRTKALLDTCFRQVEYAGVLTGADNPVGGESVLAWLLSEPVQAALPDSMYVRPVVDGVPVPPDWARFAPQPAAPYLLEAGEIAERREEWLTTWTDLTSG